MVVKNKEKTKTRLLNSLKEIVENEGFEKVSIQKIAKKAGCDKVLVYRYFGNLDGIIEDFVSKFDFFDRLFESLWNEIDKIKNKNDLPKFLEKALIEFLSTANSEKLTLEILRWEMNNSKVAELIEFKRKFFVRTLFREITRKIDADLGDIEDMFNFLLGTLNYLLLKSLKGREFGKFNFQDDGWYLIGKSVSNLLQFLKKSTS